MVLKEGSEKGFGSGVVVVIVNVEDCGYTIFSFELNHHCIVCAWNVDVLPVLCFEGFADPGYRSNQ